MNDLINLAKQSTEFIERENWRYYYQADNYKFSNVYLADWYEQTHNSWAAFVAQPITKIKEKLKLEKFDLNFDYELAYLKKLRSENNYLQLFFSGGSDSLTILKKAVDNDIYIDELVAVASGNSLDLPENREIVLSAIPEAKKYHGKYGKFTVKQTTLNQYREKYADPLCLFKLPDLGGQVPIFRRMWWVDWEPFDGKRILGCDKPQLIHYNNRWYTVLMDQSMNGTYGIGNNNDSVFIKFEPDNIFSMIKDSIDYRNYIIENNLLTESKLQFFKMTNKEENKIINRIEPSNKENLFTKERFTSWNAKDKHAIEHALQQQDIRVLTGYFKALDNVLNVYPNYNYESVSLSPRKIGWFIDIDSLEAYTQVELIPKGFEL